MPKLPLDQGLARACSIVYSERIARKVHLHGDVAPFHFPGAGAPDFVHWWTDFETLAPPLLSKWTPSSEELIRPSSPQFARAARLPVPFIVAQAVQRELSVLSGNRH
jgi:hypothetical protein